MPQPLIFNEIKYIPHIEVAIHRGLWSFVFLFIFLSFFSKLNDFYSIFFSLKKILVLTITAMLISINWTGFIYAVSIEKVHEASMGYYITPIISIFLGYVFLNEKISKLKFLSLIMMITSITFLIFTNKTIPIIAIIIGFTWGVYGLLRKQIDIKPEIGLFYESGLITLIAGPYLIYLYYYDLGYFLNYSYSASILLILAGIVTIFPLFFFNLGIKYIPLGLAGVLFYLAPTFHFITSIFILNENLNQNKLLSFIIIWLAIIIYIFDVVMKEKIISENNTQLLN
tara:strand:+ start:29504 stop:30355 length:852 start_codon:yes stop_codon:yes gene_type:complete